MAFDLFSDVILTADVPAEDLRAGDVGTVVEHHSATGPILSARHQARVWRVNRSACRIMFA